MNTDEKCYLETGQVTADQEIHHYGVKLEQAYAGNSFS